MNDTLPSRILYIEEVAKTAGSTIATSSMATRRFVRYRSIVSNLWKTGVRVQSPLYRTDDTTNFSAEVSTVNHRVVSIPMSSAKKTTIYVRENDKEVLDEAARALFDSEQVAYRWTIRELVSQNPKVDFPERE